MSSRHRDFSQAAPVFRNNPSFKDKVAMAASKKQVPESGEVARMIPLDDIVFYHRETSLSDGGEQIVFKDYDSVKLNHLADDIETNGLLEPITVFLNENGKYECLAGKHRTKASRLVAAKHPERNQIMAIVLPLEKVSANEWAYGDLVYVNSNMYRRNSLSLSELGMVYEMMFRAQSHQGVRGSNPNQDIADRMQDTVSHVRQLRNIIPEKIISPFLDLVDKKYIALTTAATELCYIDKLHQTSLYKWGMRTYQDAPAQVGRKLGRAMTREHLSSLRQLIAEKGEEYSLTDEDLDRIFLTIPVKTFQSPRKKFLQQIVPAEAWENVEEYLRIAVEEYQKNHQ